jgi:3-methyl-2-oxobutanoate hydroxymethyltransferase
MHQKLLKILEKKKNGTPFSVVTAYDYPTAKIEEEVGIDLILVGDSVGTNVLGYSSETEVTMADMVHHLKAVCRGAPNSCIMVDVPFGAAPDPFTAFENGRLLIENGADVVKIEGWKEQKNTVMYLTEMGVPVCGHIGYNPQYHGSRAHVFGKDSADARELIRSAQTLEQAGAVLLLIEKVAEEVCRYITEKIKIPVIGIGSGRFCDAQVLVFHDIVGLSERSFKHARAFATLRDTTTFALRSYKNEVEQRLFPAEENVVHCSESVVQEAVAKAITDKQIP